MDKDLRRAYFIELIGTFMLVYVSAGVVCVNHMTCPSGQEPGTASMLGHQPGLVGVALAQGLILAAALAVTAPLSGGFLNPAITLVLWVFNRLSSARMAWLIGAQAVGAVLAGFCLSKTFAEPVLRDARVGTPHLNPLVYPDLTLAALAGGSAVEVALTFFLVLAIFGTWREGSVPERAGLTAGLTFTACVLFGFALTGASTNPARWLGTALWELHWLRPPRNPFADVFAYLAGPVVGALLAGVVYFRLLLPARLSSADPSEPSTRPAEPPRPTTARARK
jgi:glycerol uptake facilitator-like aquaporin